MPVNLIPHINEVTITQAVLNLLIALVLAVFSATIYRRLHSGPAYSFSFFVTLIVTPMVMTMVIMAIGSNVALSLGLVGALSIIRFRTVIKDTRDMSFLFLMIGIGLCCGSSAYMLAVVGTLFVGAALIGIHAVEGRRGGTREYILVFRRDGHDLNGADEVLAELAEWRKLHGAADLGRDVGCEFTYRIKLAETVEPEMVIHRLNGIAGLHDSSLVSAESQLAI